MSKAPSIALIDAHIHLQGTEGIPGLLAMIDECPLRAAGIAAIPRGMGKGLGQNVAALLAKALNPEKVFVFGGSIKHYPTAVSASWISPGRPGACMRRAATG